MKENYRVDANYRWLGSEIKANEELCLTVCGIEQCRPDKSYGPVIRDDYHVHIILQGKGVLEVNGRSYELRRGQIFVTIPGEEVFYRADPSNPWVYTWVSFCGTRAEFFLEKAGISRSCPVRETFINPEDFLVIAEKILNQHELTVSNELIRTSLLYEFVSLLVSSYSSSLPKEKRERRFDYSADIYVKAAEEYIHHNYSKIKVSDIADYIGISRYYLTHLFKDNLKVSPQEYLLNYRMHQGYNLLCSTELSVGEIAERVGYENALTFSKSFKKIYDISPKLFRQKMKNEGKL